MSLRKRLALGLAWMFAGSWTEQAANFLVFILLARLLGPEAFGLAAMSIVFVLFAEFLVRETMTESLIALDDVEDGHRDAVFWLLGSFAVFVVVLIVLCANPISALFSEPRVADYIAWATPSVLFIGFSGVPVAMLRRGLEFRILAIRATVGVVAGGIVGVAMALADYGVWSLIGQRLMQVFVNSALAWLACPWRPGLRATRQHIQDVIGFSTQMIGLRASELVSLNAPTLVIGTFLGPVLLGQYTIAWRLIEILSFVLTTPIRFVALPAFAHLNRSGRNPGELLTQIMRISALVTFAAFLGMAAVAEPAMTVAFGPEWVPAAQGLRILSAVGIYLSIERLHQAFLVALGKAGRMTVLTFVEAVLGVCAMWFVVDAGLVGITIAFALAYYIIWPLRIRLVLHHAALAPLSYLRIFAIPLASALLLFVAVDQFQKTYGDQLTPIALLASSIVLGVLVYATCIAATLRGELRDLLQTLQTMRQAARSDDDF